MYLNADSHFPTVPQTNGWYAPSGQFWGVQIRQQTTTTHSQLEFEDYSTEKKLCEMATVILLWERNGYMERSRPISSSLFSELSNGM